MPKPVTAQAAAVNQLLAQGFTVDEIAPTTYRMVKGNDRRLVLQNGTVKRALGAKR